MKNIVKQLVMAFVVAAFAIPAFAADINKGNKSYQTPSKPTEETAAAAPESAPEDVADIAPAAGDQDTPAEEASSDKSMKEQIRLPRKN